LADVLVVEDDPILRDRLAEALREHYPDLDVRVAGSVEDAESALGGSVPRAVVSDLWLPGRSGVDFLVEAAGRWPKTGFVLMSARSSPEAIARSERSGVRFLAKPFEPEDLFALLDELFDAQAFSGSVAGITLVDLLQVLHLGGRSATLWVRRGRESGSIVLERGEVVDATLDDARGTEAFERMLSWPGGRFGAALHAPPRERTIDVPFHPLLLESMRRMDEARR
jgi:DNA-binding response OmpR family regulator